MIVTTKDSPSGWDKGRDENSFDIILIHNASKYAFYFSNKAEGGYSDMYREFEVEFPEGAPYGEYTYVLCHTTGSEWTLSKEILDSVSAGYVLRDIMMETGLLTFVDEEVKDEPIYREMEKKADFPDYTYRKRKRLDSRPFFSYKVEVITEDAATVWYADESKETVLWEGAGEHNGVKYRSVYVECKKEGYVTKGVTLTGVEDTVVEETFELEKATKILYTTTDGNTVEGYFLYAKNKSGNVLSCTNTYSDGQGVFEFNGEIEELGMQFYGISNLKTFDGISGISGKVKYNKGVWFTFANSKSLEQVNLADFDTSDLTNMNYAFENCKNLTTIHMEGWDTSKVTSMQGMFFNCQNLRFVFGMDDLDTSSVTDMSYMFYCCYYLVPNVSKWNTSKVTDMGYMFFGCLSNGLWYMDDWDTSSVTNMNSMFRECQYVESADFSKWNTSKVTDMRSMFQNCYRLQELNLTGWDTSKVIDMSGMFWKCYHLTTVNGLSDFDTSSLNSMYAMFYNCQSLESFDFTKWNTSKMADSLGMARTFLSCTSLTSIRIGDDCIMNYDKSSLNIFGNVPEGGTLYYPLGMDADNVERWLPTGWNMVPYSSDSTIIRYTSTDGKIVAPDTLSATDADGNALTYTNTYSDGQGIIEFSGIVSSIEMDFQSCTTLKTFDGSNHKLKFAEKTYEMFYNCTSLTSVDVSNFDTSEVTNMNCMFEKCEALVGVDLRNLDTSKVITMEFIFNRCSSLTSLDVSNFDTSSVTNMRGMFRECTNLTTLKIGSNCNIGSDTTTTMMFDGLPSSGTLQYPSGMDSTNVAKWTPTGWTAAVING